MFVNKNDIRRLTIIISTILFLFLTLANVLLNIINDPTATDSYVNMMVIILTVYIIAITIITLVIADMIIKRNADDISKLLRLGVNSKTIGNNIFISAFKSVFIKLVITVLISTITSYLIKEFVTEYTYIIHIPNLLFIPFILLIVFIATRLSLKSLLKEKVDTVSDSYNMNTVLVLLLTIFHLATILGLFIDYSIVLFLLVLVSALSSYGVFSFITYIVSKYSKGSTRIAFLNLFSTRKSLKREFYSVLLSFIFILSIIGVFATIDNSTINYVDEVIEYSSSASFTDVQDYDSITDGQELALYTRSTTGNVNLITAYYTQNEHVINMFTDKDYNSPLDQSALTTDQAVISTVFALTYNLSVGDTFTINNNYEEKTYSIANIIYDFDYGGNIMYVVNSNIVEEYGYNRIFSLHDIDESLYPSATILNQDGIYDYYMNIMLKNNEIITVIIIIIVSSILLLTAFSYISKVKIKVVQMNSLSTLGVSDEEITKTIYFEIIGYFLLILLLSIVPMYLFIKYLYYMMLDGANVYIQINYPFFKIFSTVFAIIACIVLIIGLYLRKSKLKERY